MNNAAAAIKAAYIHLAAYYGQTLSDRTVIMYAEDLIDLSVQDVLLAMKKLRREPGRRFCPLPSDLRRLIAPDSISDGAMANDIAARIGSAMSRYGYTNTERARQYVGEVGWVVVERMGGWRHLCNTTMTDDMRTFHAQCRELARAQLEIARMRPRGTTEAPLLPEPPAQLGPRPLQSMAEILERSAFAPACGKLESPPKEDHHGQGREDARCGQGRNHHQAGARCQGRQGVH